jgi:site-specific DNA recombinase
MGTALYVRVSTDEQAKEGHYSLDSQVNACLQYCSTNSLTPSYIFRETYSGNKWNRPELSKMIEGIRDGTITAIVCFSDDRLTRNTSHWLQILEILKEHRCSLHYAQQGKVEFNPESEMLSGIKSQFNQYWLQKIISTNSKGRRDKAMRGIYVGSGKPPFGYKVEGSREHTRLVLDDTYAPIVSEIYELYLSGYPLRAIADTLNERAIPIPNKANDKYTQGRVKNWHSTTVQRILTNKVYTGTFTYGRNTDAPIDIEVPALVTMAQWNTVQATLARNKIFNRPDSPFLLAGRVSCGCCGYHVSGSNITNKRKDGSKVTYRYYRPVSIGNSGVPENTCSTPRYNASHLDNAVWSAIKVLLLDESNLKANLKAVQQEQQANSPLTRLQADKASTERAIQSVEKEQYNLLKASQQGTFPMHLLEKESRELEDRRKGLLSELSSIQDQIDSYCPISDSSIDTVVSFADTIRDSLEELDIESDANEVRQIIELLDVKVTLQYNAETKERGCRVDCHIASSIMPDVTSLSRKVTLSITLDSI